MIVNDHDSRGGSGHGSDNDPQKAFEYKMHVIRLDQIQLVYYNYHTGYPYKDDPIKPRAIVWFSCTGSAGPHCDLPFDFSLQYWWMAGSEGPQADSVPPPATPIWTLYVADWPNFLPPLQIEWKWLKHKGSNPPTSGGHSRIYSYEESTYLANAWGQDNVTFDQPGVHRFRATARLHPGTAWPQSKTSLDKEYALRICPKDPDIYVEPSPPPANSAQRRSYLEWLSTYENEPYEWGGEGFGGRDSGGQYVGGGDGYDGYGVDCSGLVSCGAYTNRAGYNWPSWRQTTCSLTSVSTYLGSNWKDVIRPGDIIDKPHHHVISYLYTIGAAPSRRLVVIEAAGKPTNRVWRTSEEDPVQHYTEAELDADCTCDVHKHGDVTCAANPPPQRYRGRVLTQY